MGKRLFRWRTGEVDCGGPFGWERVPHALLFGRIIPKLHEFETMQWHQLIAAASHHHECEVGGMCKAAQDRLVELGKEDHDVLFSLRVSGKERVWGIRDRSVLQLLWWDPEHQVFPSKR